MAKIAKIFGPPGTGKTTYMINQIIKDINRKYYPSAIGAMSLTNAAIDQMKMKIREKLVVDKEHLKNFGTIHSHCFKLLGITRDQVAETPKRIKEFSEGQRHNLPSTLFEYKAP